ncbi:uncharacterized protein LOC120276130 isoform X2 [Dioscorea cayenensis subsp. rotundata]|uniref:Uncharacterized protein LOC120276130 isoform X2 n=1 Tax=Dioscorea cayennensis subsp. rotundata TaxID=55577 RepID=A0AB40CG30_DIOCR|nr:uncharacterized protein LOC120276130 isoform X2 [Dioscorea cayenensis subsp. rotundata]
MLDGRKKLRHAQRNLHLLLKPELSSICGTLRLPVDVKCLAEKLLEYVMNNHLVVRDPETILFSSTPWMVRNETRAGTETFIRVEDNTKYLQSGPPFLILLHPALGPLWEITRQKIRLRKGHTTNVIRILFVPQQQGCNTEF